MNTKYSAAIEFIKHAKAAYRKDAAAQTWEQKIAAVERMRDASRLCREAMQKALTEQKK